MTVTVANPLAEQVYTRLKDEIFNFRLLPGDNFTETEMAQRQGVSRTPLRDALFRLQREGYLEVGFRRGWRVCPIDFDRLDNLYDLRIVLEMASLEKLCQQQEPSAGLQSLNGTWLVAPEARLSDAVMVAELDEAFHTNLVAAAGNDEMTRVHTQVTEKIRIVRRLDFLKKNRVDATYEEHGKILQLIAKRKTTEAQILLRAHITQSKLEVRKITIWMLAEARQEQTTDPTLQAHR
ncbi:GntR family transcriptional regulator [Herbaspirillum sp. alder98]|uniref:GntR family transcriptional regulator n=1 Tax=Herbaspirillum sp. alder98 TaxID=2913096 RepID=UPI001CD82156|nr:GntR family transcriptional regulator [Herbaspirillum sp. alder98]MCA1323299.1 GntR family transcriptional regulator [Herbaspirillum sp. alder98]